MEGITVSVGRMLFEETGGVKICPLKPNAILMEK
jgi:hypothetical protein